MLPIFAWQTPGFHRLASFRPRISVLALYLAFGMLSSRANAEKYEERIPQNAAFNSDAMLIVYSDQVTPAGETLPQTKEIWTVFAEGQGKTRLTSGHMDENPRFSPDGKQILFERAGDLWMIDTLGAGLRNITNTPAVKERGAQFSNEGDKLFLLSPAPAGSAQGEKEVAKTPFLALFIPNTLVEWNLKDGSRRQLLDDTYHVEAVLPDPFNNNEVIVLCNALQANGHPDPFGEKALVAVPLNGGAPRMIYSPPKPYELRKAMTGGEYLVLSLKSPQESSEQLFLIKKSEALAKPNPAEHQQLESFSYLGDISCEGTHIVGTNTAMRGPDETKAANLFCHRLEIYDIATQKRRTVIQE